MKPVYTFDNTSLNNICDICYQYQSSRCYFWWIYSSFKFDFISDLEDRWDCLKQIRFFSLINKMDWFSNFLLLNYKYMYYIKYSYNGSFTLMLEIDLYFDRNFKHGCGIFFNVLISGFHVKKCCFWTIGWNFYYSL